MSWLFVGATLILALGVAGFALWLWRRMARSRHLPVRRVLLVACGGALVSVLAYFIERQVLNFSEVSRGCPSACHRRGRNVAATR
jgi:hypothetical protein